jgi:hydroxyethylthiazole kinase-like uncharacterized protein yjeF
MGRTTAVRLIDEALLRRWPLPELDDHADKVARGDVLVVAGSVQMPGAGLLAATAALRAGAGRAQLATPRTVAPPLAIAFPEARVLGMTETRGGELSPRCAKALHRELRACRALLIGPGMGGSDVASNLMREARAVGCTATAVLDAGAIQYLAQRRRAAWHPLGGVIATPHAGELAKLWGCEAEQVHESPLSLGRDVARHHAAVFVVKGTETFIVAPDGTAFRNVAGNVGLATAGSGDTLGGLIAGLAARGAEPLQAAVWGVYLHARAGEVLAQKVGSLGYLARELAGEVPMLLDRLANPGGSRRKTRRKSR